MIEKSKDEIELSPTEAKKTLKAMSNYELNNYFKDEHNFGGVFANNELKNPQPGKAYIINLQNLGEAGSHWVFLYNSFYIDSYGLPPTKHISKFVKSYNPYQYQSLSQNSCGFHSAFVAANIINDKNPIGELQPMKYAHNERVLKRYFN